MLTVGTILTNRVRVLLRDIDDGGVQWRDPELLQWFNEACAEIARVRPEACSGTSTFMLKAGSKQSVAAMGASPDAAATAIRVSLGWDTKQDDIDRFIDAWIALCQRKNSGTAKHLAS